VYFEGDLIKKLFKYRLENIETSKGFSFELEKNNRITMQLSTNIRSNRINFQIRGLKKDGDGFAPGQGEEHVAQQYMDRSSYRNNSEYRQKSSQLTDAYVLAIIDCSKSLGKDTQNAKDMMIEAVKTIVPNIKIE
jgi:cellulose biosynthesis protein BcsQ